MSAAAARARAFYSEMISDGRARSIERTHEHTDGIETQSFTFMQSLRGPSPRTVCERRSHSEAKARPGDNERMNQPTDKKKHARGMWGFTASFLYAEHCSHWRAGWAGVALT